MAGASFTSWPIFSSSVMRATSAAARWPNGKRGSSPAAEVSDGPGTPTRAQDAPHRRTIASGSDDDGPGMIPP